MSMHPQTIGSLALIAQHRLPMSASRVVLSNDQTSFIFPKMSRLTIGRLAREARGEECSQDANTNKMETTSTVSTRNVPQPATNTNSDVISYFSDVSGIHSSLIVAMATWEDLMVTADKNGIIQLWNLGKVASRAFNNSESNTNQGISSCNNLTGQSTANQCKPISIENSDGNVKLRQFQLPSCDTGRITGVALARSQLNKTITVLANTCNGLYIWKGLENNEPIESHDLIGTNNIVHLNTYRSFDANKDEQLTALIGRVDDHGVATLIKYDLINLKSITIFPLCANIESPQSVVMATSSEYILLANNICNPNNATNATRSVVSTWRIANYELQSVNNAHEHSLSVLSAKIFSGRDYTSMLRDHENCGHEVSLECYEKNPSSKMDAIFATGGSDHRVVVSAVSGNSSTVLASYQHSAGVRTIDISPMRVSSASPDPSTLALVLISCSDKNEMKIWNVDQSLFETIWQRRKKFAMMIHHMGTLREKTDINNSTNKNNNCNKNNIGMKQLLFELDIMNGNNNIGDDSIHEINDIDIIGRDAVFTSLHMCTKIASFL